MIDHISTYATNFDASRNFYEKVFEVLGYSVQAEMSFDDDPDLPGRRICSFGPPGGSSVWVIESTQVYTPRHIAFTASDRSQVDAFHRAALTAGGEDNGAPGPRPIYHATTTVHSCWIQTATMLKRFVIWFSSFNSYR